MINDGDSLLQREAESSQFAQNGFENGGKKPLKRAVFCGSKLWLDRVYAKGRWEQVAKLTSLHPEVIDLENFAEHSAHLREAEVIFSTWGFPRFTPAQVDHMESLQAIFYAGGTVQSFGPQFLARNVSVVSAWQANAVPVAEFTLAQILLSTKGYFRNVRETGSPHTQRDAFQGPGNFGETIAILGAGAIGTKVIELLQQFQLRMIVYDPFLSAERASRLGVEKVSLETAFEEAFVVSNHVANVPETKRLIHGGLFARMRPGAAFINTGRGETVDEPSMISVLRERPDITALLDVTFPEPPLPDSPFYKMPNVLISGHIAGSINDELVRMADYCIEDFIAFTNNRPLRYAVSAAMLETMA